jgi:uncharacterized protein (TIGR01615 family)
MQHGSNKSDYGLFNLDLSNHGGSLVLPRLERSSAASREGWALAGYVSPATSFESKLLEAVRRLKPACTTIMGVEYARLVKLLAEAGFQVAVRWPEGECKCLNKSRKCLEKLSHTFLTFTTPSQEDGIIEPRLREQFEIAHPTPSYRALLEQLPAEFVGPASKLRTLVEAVSAAMAMAFKEMEMSLPPWRRLPATLSKWGLDKAEAVKVKFGGVGRQDRPANAQPLQDRSHRNVGFPEEAGVNLSRPSKGRAVAVQPLPIGTAGPENTGTGRPMVSLLARNLADMAALQKGKRAMDSPCAPKTTFRRAPSWDFSGLPPVNTVRRSGRVM